MSLLLKSSIYIEDRGGEFLLSVKIGIPHNHGKRYDNETKTSSKKVFGILIIVIIIIVSIVGYICIHNGNNPNTPTEDNPINAEIMAGSIEDIQPTPAEEEPLMGSNYPDKMGNYKVIGRLVIEQIDVDNYILESTDDRSLDLSVTKFDGVDINHEGNISLTGHNYEFALKRLYELEIGDTFYLVNREDDTKVVYEVFDTYSCYPTDLRCLEQETETGTKEVTLITCNPGGLTRLIYKAKEVI